MTTREKRTGWRSYPEKFSIVMLASLGLANPGNSQTLDSFNPSAMAGDVRGMVIQADGNIVVGGSFTGVGPGPLNRHRIARVLMDGTVDPNFNPNADNMVNCLALQPDGKILVGGTFTNLGGQSRVRIGRLNADGTVDNTFNPPAANLDVTSFALQPDGKILVAGIFTNVGGAYHRFVRLNADGSLDNSFNPTMDTAVYSVALQPDGKILIGGNFFIVNGQPAAMLARLDTNGVLDTTFTNHPDYNVYSIAVMNDGGLLLGGQFNAVNGKAHMRMARIDAAGNLDASFVPSAGAAMDNLLSVRSIAQQVDGRLLLGGYFETLNGQTATNVGQLFSDGTLNTNYFAIAYGGPAFSKDVGLAILTDGRVLFGGSFQFINGVARNSLGRVSGTAPATRSLSYDGTNITWLRGGGSSCPWRTTFEVSTNAIDWMFLGDGGKVTGGWQLASVAIPANATIRARGWVTGARFNGSTWFEESLLGPPTTNQPAMTATPGIGSVALTVSGDVGRPYVIEYTPVLGANANWQALSYLLLTNSTQVFIDPSSATKGQRYYRARLNQ